MWCAPAGARIAATVISRPDLFALWNKEMEHMAGRIKVRCLNSLCPCRTNPLIWPCKAACCWAMQGCRQPEPNRLSEYVLCVERIHQTAPCCDWGPLSVNLGSAGRSMLSSMRWPDHGLCTGQQSVRQLLHDELAKLEPNRDWSFVTRQIGAGPPCEDANVCVHATSCLWVASKGLVGRHEA